MVRLLLLFLCVFGVYRFSQVHGITFDGQGRLLQLEFADLAARSGGGSIIAIATNESAVLLSWDSTSTAPKVDTSLAKVSRQKLRTLSRHLGFGATGIACDINYVSNLAFDLASQHSFSFSSPAPVIRIAESLAGEMHQRTSLALPLH
jgi:20S proteasome alpha/beta subunit